MIMKARNHNGNNFHFAIDYSTTTETCSLIITTIIVNITMIILLLSSIVDFGACLYRLSELIH